MGGFGAARLGFKYPELFGVVSILAGALHRADTLAERRAEIFKSVYGGNSDYYDVNSPWTIPERNAPSIRGRTRVRLWVGDQDQLLAWNKEYHELLIKLKIEHEFGVAEGVGHNYGQLSAKWEDRGFEFYSSAFALFDPAAPHLHK